MEVLSVRIEKVELQIVSHEFVNRVCRDHVMLFDKLIEMGENIILPLPLIHIIHYEHKKRGPYAYIFMFHGKNANER